MSAQCSTLVKAKEARKFHKKLEDIEERLGVAQLVMSKARDSAKTAKKEASEFEAEYVTEVGRRKDEVGELSRQIRQQVTSATAESKKLVPVHPELELHKAKEDFLDQAMKGELEGRRCYKRCSQRRDCPAGCRCR